MVLSSTPPWQGQRRPRQKEFQHDSVQSAATGTTPYPPTALRLPGFKFTSAEFGNIVPGAFTPVLARLVTLAFALVFSANVSTAKGATETPHRRPNSDREYREHDIHCSSHRRCCEVRLRHRIGSLYLRRRRPIQRGCRHSRDQSSACSRQTLRVERDGTRRPHQRQYRLDCIRQSRQHHGRLWHREPKMARIGFSPETGGIWKIVFTHSTYFPVAPPQSHGK
jgi:hypothetical protein